MKDYKRLTVWKYAHDFTLSIYKVTRTFSKDELYGITSQIRRASTSVGTNISEGCGRGSQKEFGRFLQIAAGSASEVEYLLLLASDLDYLKKESFIELNDQVVRIKKMLNALIHSISE